MSERMERRQERREYVNSLTAKERGVFADMIMRSLRGSWRSPRERTHLLEAIAKTRDVDPYDGDDLNGKVQQYFQKIGRGSPDGRYWRRTYQDAEVEISTVDESTVREMASRIPDDMTWDDRRISKVYTDD